MTRVAVIVPTLNRAGQMRRNIGNMLMQIPPPDVKLIVVLAIQRSDVHTIAAAKTLVDLWADSDVSILIVPREPGTTCVEGFNVGYGLVRGLADWYVLGGDDQQYRSGWLAAALHVANDTGAQVVGLNDLHTNIDQYAPHYMMHADFIEHELGGFMVPPGYKTWWFDREICERARRAGLYAPAWGAIAEHCHPDWSTAELDDTYRLAMPDREADRRLYEERRARNYA